jgi:hypothetical protein
MSITLTSGDDKNFELTEDAYKKCPYIQRMVEGGNTSLKFDDIKGEVLEKVVEYLKYYADKDFPTLPESLNSSDLKTELTEGDFSFIDPISYENCFRLINAANYLELNHLFDLACAKIAAFMKGKNPEQVSEEFTIECQLTPEEAKKLGME